MSAVRFAACSGVTTGTGSASS